MPGFTTHFIFGTKVYQDLSEHNVKKLIEKHRNVYNLGLQGPDIFFFYIPSLIGEGNMNLGSLMHSKNINEFFGRFLSVINRLEGRRKEVAIVYLCGFLCHYYLDTKCHPYIYSRSEYDIEDESGRLLYYAEHRSLETIIDSLMLEKYYHKKPSQFKKQNTVRLLTTDKKLISYILSLCLSHTYYKEEFKISLECTPENYKKNKTFSKKKMPYLDQLYYRKNFHINAQIKKLIPLEQVITPKYIRRNINSVIFGCKRIANNSTYKREFIKKLEDKFIHYDLLSSLIPTDHFIDDKDYLNLKHSNWSSPWEKENIYNTSFIDLFQLASKECSQAIALVSNYTLTPFQSGKVKKEARHNLLNYIGNNSYHTGFNWRKAPEINT